MFLKQGYEAATIEQIIARAGGLKRNVYQMFGDKVGLVAAGDRGRCDRTSAQRLG